MPTQREAEAGGDLVKIHSPSGSRSGVRGQGRLHCAALCVVKSTTRAEIKLQGSTDNEHTVQNKNVIVFLCARVCVCVCVCVCIKQMRE